MLIRIPQATSPGEAKTVGGRDNGAEKKKYPPPQIFLEAERVNRDFWYRRSGKCEPRTWVPECQLFGI